MNQPKMVLTYSKYGTAVGDDNALAFIMQFANNFYQLKNGRLRKDSQEFGWKLHRDVSTWNAVLALQVQVKRGIIHNTDVILRIRDFALREREYEIDPDGNVDVGGHMTSVEAFLMELL